MEQKTKSEQYWKHGHSDLPTPKLYGEVLEHYSYHKLRQMMQNHLVFEYVSKNREFDI